MPLGSKCRAYIVASEKRASDKQRSARIRPIFYLLFGRMRKGIRLVTMALMPPVSSPYATVPEVPYCQYFRYFSNDVIKYFRRPGLRCGCSYIRASSSEQQSAQALIFAGHEGYYHNHVLIQRQRRQTFYPGGNPPRNWRYGK